MNKRVDKKVMKPNHNVRFQNVFCLKNVQIRTLFKNKPQDSSFVVKKM